MNTKHHTKHPARPPQSILRWGGFVFVGLGALLLLWFVVSCIRDIGVSTRQEVATGSVVSFTPLITPSSRIARATARTDVVRYRYVVQGKTYETSVVRSRTAYTASSVDVYYDRDNPGRSSLEDFESVSRRSRNALILVSIGIVLFALAVRINSGKATRKNRH